MWFDSHCHLNDEAFENDAEAVFDSAIAANVRRMMVVGFDLPSSRAAVALAEKHEEIWAAAGIHPHDASVWNDDVANELRELLHHPRTKALGEIGLDYHYNYSTSEEQLKAFREQMQLARELGKPVIIHSREATADTMMVLNEFSSLIAGVMHCFAGSRETAEECLNKGLYISFSGSVTFKNAHKLAAVAAEIPSERLLVETDCPYLTPMPFRGERNEPFRVTLVGEKLAELRGVSSEEIEKLTCDNASRLFGIA